LDGGKLIIVRVLGFECLKHCQSFFEVELGAGVSSDHRGKQGFEVANLKKWASGFGVKALFFGEDVAKEALKLVMIWFFVWRARWVHGGALCLGGYDSLMPARAAID